MNFRKWLQSLSSPTSGRIRRERRVGGRQRFGFEQLESRTLLAGNVTAQLQGLKALITGDASDNSFRILVDNGNVVLRGTDTTTINGGTTDFVLSTTEVMRGSITIAGGAGNDTFVVDGITARNTIRMDGEAGNDLMVVNNSILRQSLRLTGGDGDDDMVVRDTRIGDTLVVIAGAGNDDLVVDGSFVGRHMWYSGGDGDDVVQIDGTTVRKKSELNSGRGDDSILVQGNSRFRKKTKFVGGPGADNLEIQAGSRARRGKRKSFSSRMVDDQLIATRITDTTTGAVGRADAALNGTTTTDGPVQLALSESTIAENAGAAASTLTVTRPTGSTEAITVALASSDTSKLTLSSSSVTIPVGSSTATVTLTPVNNTVAGSNSTVMITATPSAPYTAGTIDVTIVDDDSSALSITASASTVVEDTGSTTTVGDANTVTYTVSRTGNTTAALVVSLATDVPDLLTVPAQVTIPAGDASVEVTASTIPDGTVEQDEPVVVTASATGFTSGTSTVTVIDNDSARVLLSFDAPSVNESGTETTSILTVSRNTATTAALNVSLVVDDPTRLSFNGQSTATVTIPAGAASATIVATAVNNTIDEADKLVTVTGTASGLTSGSDSITVVDDDTVSLTLAISGTTVAENAAAGTLKGTVTRAGADTTAALTVNLARTGDARITVPSTVTISAGQTSATFDITTVNNNLVDSPATGTSTITATATGFPNASQSVTVTDDDVATISIAPTTRSVAEDAGADSFTLAVARTDTSAAETINLSYSNSALISGPSSVFLDVGETGKTVNFDVIDNGFFAENDDVVITASATGHSSVATTVTVINDDILTLTTNTDANLVAESVGTQVTKTPTFTISGVTAPGAMVDVDLNGAETFAAGTATADSNGLYSVSVTLLNNATNGGSNTYRVRSTPDGEAFSTTTAEKKIHLAEGSVVRFELNQDLDGNGSSDFYDIELFDTDAPITVENFLSYTTSTATGTERFDNLLVQRKVTDFVIQGGRFNVVNGVPVELDRDADNNGQNDTITNEFAVSGHSNVRGTLSMALPANTPNGGSSEWFINTVDNTFLDGALHTVFGQVIGDGMMVVDAIDALPDTNLNGHVYGELGALSNVPFSNVVDFTEYSQALTGTVSITLNTNVLTGVGTSFLSELSVGSAIKFTGFPPITVSAISSNTSLTLDFANYPTEFANQFQLAGATGFINARPPAADLIVFTNIGEILDSI
ncbi:MAG: peptidylprolyl isomerase [Planctomycetaceae bacterium]|nr:peptidylprolyl isomerase [Planctomycetaceae bacterium]